MLHCFTETPFLSRDRPFTSIVTGIAYLARTKIHRGLSQRRIFIREESESASFCEGLFCKESFTVSAMKVFPRTHELPSSQALQQGAASPQHATSPTCRHPPPPLRRRRAIMPLKRWISVRGTFRKRLPPFNPRSSRKQEQRAAVDRQPFLSEIKPPSPLDKANRGADSERSEDHQRRSRPLSPTQSARPKKAREQTAVCHKKTDFLFRADQAFSRYYKRMRSGKSGEIAAGKTRQPRICNFK